MNPKTGDRVWEYRLHTKPWAGVLTTAGRLLFGGSDEGYFPGRRKRQGTVAAEYRGNHSANPVSYLSHGRKVIAIAAGNAIFTFDLQQ